MYKYISCPWFAVCCWQRIPIVWPICSMWINTKGTQTAETYYTDKWQIITWATSRWKHFLSLQHMINICQCIRDEAEIILCMGPVNEIRRYTAVVSLIGYGIIHELCLIGKWFLAWNRPKRFVAYNTTVDPSLYKCLKNGPTWQPPQTGTDRK